MRNLVFLLLTSFALTYGYSARAQVIVNKVDLNKAVDTFEVYAFKKPFSTKECFFANYGQKAFKLHWYDDSSQAIFDNTGRKFEKGEWLQLSNYLKSQGWKKTDNRTEKLGNIEGRVVTFEREPSK